jgi:hypothetical protein
MAEEEKAGRGADGDVSVPEGGRENRFDFRDGGRLGIARLCGFAKLGLC